MPDIPNNKPSADPSGASALETSPRHYTALQGVGRAMEILEEVATTPMRASDIVQRMGLKWTTAYRSLTYLLDNNYLRRDEPSGVYSIGPRLYSLGQAYLLAHPLLDAGTLSLRALAHETGSTAQLNERDGFESTVLMAVDQRPELIPKTTPEYHFPLHAGSKGQVLLAFSDPSIFRAMIEQPLLPLTDRTITDPAELFDRLAMIRKQGAATTREDVQSGTGSTAAPIFDQTGMIVGAICVIKKVNEMSAQPNDPLTSDVTAAARDISLRLGWRHTIAPACQSAWNSEQRPPSTKQAPRGFTKSRSEQSTPTKGSNSRKEASS